MERKNVRLYNPMKHILLAAIILPVVLFAQAPQHPPPIRQPVPPGSQTPTDVLPDNYQVTLTITDMGGQPLELSVVVVSRRFSASLADPSLTFSGVVTLEDSGNIIIAYTLHWATPVAAGKNDVASRSASTEGSVRLKPGEEIQIIRAGPHVARLSIKKLEATRAK